MISFALSGQSIKLPDKPMDEQKTNCIVFGFIRKKFVNKCRECFTKFLDWEIWFLYKDNKIIW